MTETAADFSVQITDAYYDIATRRPTLIDAFVDWLPFGRRERPLKRDQLRLGKASLQIRRGVVFGLAVSNALLRSKVFASIEGREAPAEGTVLVKGSVASAPRIRGDLSSSMSVSEALMEVLLVSGGDRDQAKRRLEASILFAGMLDLAYVKIQDVSESDRARLAVAACLFREADIFLLDEISLIFDRATLEKICGRAALLAASGKTVVLASTNYDWLKANCTALVGL